LQKLRDRLGQASFPLENLWKTFGKPYFKKWYTKKAGSFFVKLFLSDFHFVSLPKFFLTKIVFDGTQGRFSKGFPNKNGI